MAKRYETASAMVLDIVLISVIRKGAFKRLNLSSSKESYLSICQIFESTDDVVDYYVVGMDSNFKNHDMWLPDNFGFPKWAKMVSV